MAVEEEFRSYQWHLRRAEVLVVLYLHRHGLFVKAWGVERQPETKTFQATS